MSQKSAAWLSQGTAWISFLCAGLLFGRPRIDSPPALRETKKIKNNLKVTKRSQWFQEQCIIHQTRENVVWQNKNKNFFLHVYNVKYIEFLGITNNFLAR
jgi:hypothetical protein